MTVSRKVRGLHLMLLRMQTGAAASPSRPSRPSQPPAGLDIQDHEKTVSFVVNLL